MIYDFHTHTTLSDGVLSPIELIRRAVHNGYRAIALTDHVGVGQMERFIAETSRDCTLAEKYWDIRAIPGVELTHLPPEAIADAARDAKRMGAKLVVVHGETVVEDVAAGTNLAALQCRDVDYLAHPGLITLGEAELAAKNGIALEISGRKGHCLTNGHVSAMARRAGAKVILGSDAHDINDLLTLEMVRPILMGAGLTAEEIDQALGVSVKALMNKIG